MKRNLLLWQLTGLTFTAVFGTLLHFLYNWTDCIALAPFCAVNESTWEHMKIMFFPMLLFAFIQYAGGGKSVDGFWCINLLGTLIGVTLIPVSFYTYNGAVGRSPDWLNILIFFLSAFLAYLVEYLLFRRENACKLPSAVSLVILITIAVAFVLFTFIPPQIPLFQDPLTSTYGI